MSIPRPWQRVVSAGWLVSAIIGVAQVRMWRLHLREVEQRAEEAERTREELARRRAAEERLRIARELHDSLTHSISVVTVQAGVAVHLARKRGEEIPPALLAIQQASADAARELRATLGLLRGDDDGGHTGVDRLPALVEQTRAAGVPATLSITGRERALPADIDQAVFRIVQEALTNVHRHAGHAAARVNVEYGPGAVTVQVDDDGTGPARPARSGGLGLLGMRERVAALGGTLRAAPRDGGGFTVRAEVPLPS